MSFSWQWRLKQMMLIFLYSDFLVFILNHWCFMLWPLIDGLRPRWWWWSMLSRWTLCMIFGTCSSRLRPIWNTMHLTVCSFVYQKKKKKSVFFFILYYLCMHVYIYYIKCFVLFASFPFSFYFFFPTSISCSLMIMVVVIIVSSASHLDVCSNTWLQIFF